MSVRDKALRWRPGRRAALVLALTMLALLGLRFAFPATPLREHASLSRAFFSSDGTLLRMTLSADEQYRVWTPLEAMSPQLIEAVKLYEDRWFDGHPGVNPFSLARGAWTTFTGGTRRGASTLTMQLARRVLDIDSRTMWGKAQQVGGAVWLEARHSKHDLLEAYLNLAPYGGNIEGVGAASLIYFNKRADRLTLPEALTLAVIPQNPNRRAAVAASGDTWPLALSAARERLWQAWQQAHPAQAGAPEQVAAQAALTQPLHLRSPRQLPFLAPHAVQAAIQRLPARSETVLSLHAPTQAAVERSLRQFVQSRRAVGVRNASALLVDTHSLEVKAWVGSHNHFDADIDGQVNGTTAKRSPGSTLKPFIYGLALDQGLIHPRSVLRDAPTSFGTYSPENFDGRFEGPITAQDALIKSRNIPAVGLSARLAQPSLYEFLQRAQVRQLASERHYGLALTLGGGEVTMEELAGLYAMLANGGGWAPLRYAAAPWPGDAVPSQPLLSPEAAHITLDMLQRNPRPDTGRPASPPVAWKTGTSWGFRDAWTAGVFGRYVLVVWVGEFDGRSNPAFVGIQTAAPLFFQIVDSLRSQGLDPGPLARAAPANLARVPVCAASGDLPNAHCKDLAETWFIPGKSPIRVSTLHRAVWVDAQGRAACGPGPGVREEIFEHWGSDMLQVFAQAGMPRRPPPAPPRCDAATGTGTALLVAGDVPRIVSPLQGAQYLLRLSQPTPLNLRANAARAGTPLYWFAEAAYLGQSAPGKDLPWTPPAAGRYLLSAVDDQGQTDTREVQVEFAP
ncbi:MAG: penicillin-binding protein 1C [Pseudomonadota bacterium]